MSALFSPSPRRVHRYGVVPMLLHWALVPVVAGAAGLAIARPLAGAAVPTLVGWHAALGLAAWAGVWLLVAWRLIGRPPVPEASLFAWQRAVHAALRQALYTLLLIVPPLGYLAASAQGGWVRIGTGNFLPGLAIAPDLRVAVVAAHRGAAWLLLAVVAVHAGIALYHHGVLRDRLLRRMLPEPPSRRFLDPPRGGD